MSCLHEVYRAGCRVDSTPVVIELIPTWEKNISRFSLLALMYVCAYVHMDELHIYLLWTFPGGGPVEELELELENLGIGDEGGGMVGHEEKGFDVQVEEEKR